MPSTDNDFHPTEDMAIISDGISKLPHQNLHTTEPDCYGHICPTCRKSWMHSYKCWPNPKVSEEMYCPEHFGQCVVEMHRTNDIKKLVEKVPVDRLKEMQLEHESFCVLEATKSGNYEEWFEKHLLNLKEMQIKLANHEAGAKKARAGLRQEDAGKLTTEEITQFTRDASRQKKRRQKEDQEIKEKDNSKSEWTKMLKSLLPLVGNNAELAIKQLKIIYESQGKEIPQL
jgi:hypothetical protein